jgi:hypothetical protein
VRQEGAGGKIVWCTLELPPEADLVDVSVQPPARIASTALAAGLDGADRQPSTATRLPGSELVWSKLWPPAPRAGLIPRAGLQSRLQEGVQAKLCLLDAPAEFGKTTLLTQWRAAVGAARVAWVALDEGDNDPTRFWSYLVAALRTVQPGLGTAALEVLHQRSADPYRAVLPGLLNELDATGSQLVLVLDDYHLIANPACHQTLGFFLERLPAGVHVVLATRADPPLPLARMWGRGELAELRAADLQFSHEEISRGQSNGVMPFSRLARSDACGLTLLGRPRSKCSLGPKVERALGCLLALKHSALGGLGDG